MLAHEVGHVVRRHGLRSVYQSAGVVFLAALLLGDVSSATSLAVSLPVVLVQKPRLLPAASALGARGPGRPAQT